MRQTKKPVGTVTVRSELIAAAKALIEDVRKNQLAGTHAIAVPIGNEEWLAIGDAKTISRLLADG